MLTQSAFSAGAASVEVSVTPNVVDNSLHSTMSVRFDEKGSLLFAKALAMKMDSTEVLLISLDQMNIPGEHLADLKGTISRTVDLNPDSIIISATHSHSAPHFEPLGDSEGSHPYYALVRECARRAAERARQSLRPARWGQAVTYVAGASFNTRVPLSERKVKFTRDFREGLASGRPVDPRLNVLRIDDTEGKPIAGWVRFAAHPACVIFNAPVSAEYPGYMTDRISREAGGGAPVLFGYGASGDVNCVPMFGTESDARNLGHRLADIVAPVFSDIVTRTPGRLLLRTGKVDLPLDPPPSIESLDREMEEMRSFIRELDQSPNLVWVLGFNCGDGWTVEKKKAYVRPIIAWAEMMKKAVTDGIRFPAAWTSEVTALIIDDLGLVFYPGEPFTELGLGLSHRSPLPETLFIAHSNGHNGYIGTDKDRRRGGYATYLWNRSEGNKPGRRPLPYSLGAAERLLQHCVRLIEELSH